MKKFISFVRVCVILASVILLALYLKEKMFDDDGNFVFLGEIISDIFGEGNDEEFSGENADSFLTDGVINDENEIIYDNDGNVISDGFGG